MFFLLRKLSRYFYHVPWCVPAWGWSEFLATVKVLLRGSVTSGDFPSTFADNVKAHIGVGYAIPVNRGRSAITIAIRALGLAPDDEIILPSYVCSSVLDAVVKAGAKPVFCDIGDDLHMTSATVRAAMTPQTRCVIVPHLFGNVAPIDEIENMLVGTGIHLIDDAAQSFGALCSGKPIGSFGTCGIVSCGPGKTLAGPAGGVLVTDSESLFKKARACNLPLEDAALVAKRQFRFWVWRRFRKFSLPFSLLLERFGMTAPVEPERVCRLSNLDAAIALSQLRKLGSTIRTRRHNAGVIHHLLGNFSADCISDFSDNGTIVKYIVLLPGNGDASAHMMDALADIGIEAQEGFHPLHDAKLISLPRTEILWKRVVCIPVDGEFRGRVQLAGLGQGCR